MNGIAFKEKWFPFVTLSNGIKKRIINHVRSGWNVDELLSDIAKEVKEAAPALLERWERSHMLAPHFSFLKNAIGRYLDEDYMSAVAILYPQIEGIMRTCLLERQHGQRVTQKTLADSPSLLHDSQDSGYSLLLPAKFREYIQTVFFASFEPGLPAPLSRNSVAHGVADAADYSLKAATLAVLIVDQIYYHLPPEHSEEAKEEDESL